MPFYLRYGKIKGEVTEPAAYRGWIELHSFQWAVSRSVSSPTGTTSSREGSSSNVSEITVTKKYDSTSVLLYQEALTGEGVVAYIDFVKDRDVLLRYTLTGTMVTSYHLSGGGDKPTESLSLNFEKVGYKQTPGGPPPPP